MSTREKPVNGVGTSCASWSKFLIRKEDFVKKKYGSCLTKMYSLLIGFISSSINRVALRLFRLIYRKAPYEETTRDCWLLPLVLLEFVPGAVPYKYIIVIILS